MSRDTQHIEDVDPSENVRVDFTLNGEPCHAEVPTSTVLLTMLRRDLDLIGVRGSCERGVCGACTVLVDHQPVASCALFAFDAEGTDVETIEGQQVGDQLSPVQRAFSECGGFQCGYCTPGMVLLATALLRTNAKPDREQIREWIGSNICRCTGYEMILESVERASQLAEDHAEGDHS